MRSQQIWTQPDVEGDIHFTSTRALLPIIIFNIIFNLNYIYDYSHAKSVFGVMGPFSSTHYDLIKHRGPPVCTCMALPYSEMKVCSFK